QDVIENEPVALFMKGTPQFVMCGNSDRALRALREAGAPVTAVDILPDPAIRQELSALSGWPTIPQGFPKGELIGGGGLRGGAAGRTSSRSWRRQESSNRGSRARWARDTGSPAPSRSRAFSSHKAALSCAGAEPRPGAADQGPAEAPGVTDTGLAHPVARRAARGSRASLTRATVSNATMPRGSPAPEPVSASRSRGSASVRTAVT